MCIFGSVVSFGSSSKCSGTTAFTMVEHYFDLEKTQIASGDGLKEDVEKVLQVSPIKG